MGSRELESPIGLGRSDHDRGAREQAGLEALDGRRSRVLRAPEIVGVQDDAHERGLYVAAGGGLRRRRRLRNVLAALVDELVD